MGDYIVQRGDTLSRIAKLRLGKAVRWREIATLNSLADPNILFVGQHLRLPDNRPAAVSQMGAASQRGLASSEENTGTSEIPARIALARGFLFVVFEQLPEVGSGLIIRKVAAIPRDFSLLPSNPLGNLSPAEHVLNLNPAGSQFLSASNRPFGAPSIGGQPVLLDVAKIRAAGGHVYSVAEVVKDLERFVSENPASANQVERLIKTIRNIEGEVLVKGGAPPGSVAPVSAAHEAFIRSAEDLWQAFRANQLTRPQLEAELAALERAYSRAKVVGRVGRVLTVVAVIVTVADLAVATNQSVKQRSFRPIGAETIRQVGGWGGAIAGAKIGFAGGALLGIETGPGLFVTGAIGSIIFGAGGYFGADWVADNISPN